MMLIATQSQNIDATRQYFNQVLTQGDYYLGQEINGHWHGKGAETLGLGTGKIVAKDEFNALLKGMHPKTGHSLKQRERKDRRPGMDLTFSVPKSVSLAWAINGDERLIDALREAVHETMTKDVEPLMQRRVRSGKHYRSEQKSSTGELVYADFLHKTSRPVDGKADPHLHVHAFVINWTHEDGKHFAGQFEEIVRQRPSLQAKFESRLARRLRDQLGYAVTPTRFRQSGRIKAGWEIEGIERATLEKFSRRTLQVENEAATKGIRDEAKKAKLGKQTREKKDDGARIPDLRDEWRSRLSDREREQFDNLGKERTSQSAGDERMLISKSIQYALDHHLYRQSTAERHQIVGTALEHGLTFTPEEIEAALDKHGVINRSIEKDGAARSLITTREVLEAERRMIDFARDERGTRKAIGRGDYQFSMNWLNEQQKAAVNHVLSSRDTVMVVTGGAGTGKSSLMKEAAEAIEAHGKKVFTFAPSTGAKEVLEDKGFDQTQTVEHLIRNTKLPPELKEQVIWIDEAGLLDVRSMNVVFDIAKEQNARVILSGDTRQHSSPRRGEAMRLLEDEAGLKIARVEAIQRQKGQYRSVVESISRGHEIDESTGKSGLLAGFDKLDAMGKVIEVKDHEKHTLLAQKYLSLTNEGKSTLVVAPTHTEGKAATEEIRSRLKDRGEISKVEQATLQLVSLNLTEAEKREATTYREEQGAIIQFHQNCTGEITRGQRYRVAGAMGNEVVIEPIHGGEAKFLPLNMSDRFEVYREAQLQLAAGDKVRFSLGGKAMDGRTRISNGRLDTIKAFDADGNMVLQSGHSIDKDYGHIDLGYVITSHASQGKDRDVVIGSMGSESLPAINAKTLYVSVSRGSDDVVLYVDDKAKVRRAIEKSGQQLSATELTRNDQSKTCGENKKRSAGYQRDHQVRRQGFAIYKERVKRWWRAWGRSQELSRTEARNREMRAFIPVNYQTFNNRTFEA